MSRQTISSSLPVQHLGDNQTRRRRDERAFDLFHVGKARHAIEAMIYGNREEKLRPLIMLNTMEAPAPPPVAYCEFMRDAGLQVIFVRRPGFGRSAPQPDMMAQALSVFGLIRQLELDNAVLIGVSTANPVAYRLAKMCNAVAFSIFANPVFNQDVLHEFQPAWFQSILKQAITSQAGARIAFTGIKYALRRDAIGVFLECCSKSRGDVEYIRRNPGDVINSAGLIRQADIATLHNDIRASLEEDPALTDGYFGGINAIALSGVETTPTWKSSFEAETGRLGIAHDYAASGDGFAALMSPQHVLDIIKLRAC